MKVIPKRRHLKGYKELLRLFFKYHRSDLVRDMDPSQSFLDETENGATAHTPSPEDLVNDLERLGPTYIKVGQLLSSRMDLLPERYLKSLARLQDKVKPFPFEEVEELVESELGVRLSKGFQEFDPTPLAAASLGQVHAARLRDGRPVVVKVQRPRIRKQIATDFEVLEQFTHFLDEHTVAGKRYQFGAVLEEFKATLLKELDYEKEAANLQTLAANLQEFPHIQVPLPVSDYTTRSILTMDYIRGTKITKLSPLTRLELDGESLAEEVFKAYLKQVLVDGFFHADPHPGNIFLTDDNRVALLDLGMVGRITPAMQEQLLKLILAVSEGDSDQALDLVQRISQTRDDFKPEPFRRRIGMMVAEHKDAALGQIDIGKTLLGVTKTAADTGLIVPPELTLLGKTLLQLDQLGKTLAPEFNPNAAVRRHAAEMLRKRVWNQLSPGKLMGTALDLKDFVGGLPTRVNKILDTVANAELELKVKTADTREFLAAFQKIANRITTGLVLAALIVGASLLMQVNTRFQIFGYPGLAIICFLAAAGGGFWLVLSTLIHDYKDRRRVRP